MTPSLQSSNETDNENKQPWWVNPLYKFGIPSAIAIFLVWFLTEQVRATLYNIDESLKDHVTFSEITQKNNERMLRILQQICVNSSSTNEERLKCFQ